MELFSSLAVRLLSDESVTETLNFATCCIQSFLQPSAESEILNCNAEHNPNLRHIFYCVDFSLIHTSTQVLYDWVNFWKFPFPRF